MDTPLDSFLRESAWHGPLDAANAILAANPAIADDNIYAAAVLGNGKAVQRFLELDPQLATAKGGPFNRDALTYLCFSRYLRLDPDRSEGFMRAAKALLDAGASANTGFFDNAHLPQPEWESALYGAAGVAFHAGLTRLLLEHGADPNDEEVPYHSPETYDNAALEVLIESGKLSQESLSTMLLRKADFHDHDGLKLLLEAGADPNRMTRWHHTALQQALRRDNDLKNIEVQLDYGADPLLPNRENGRNAVSIAVRRGRGDVLAAFKKRGIPIKLQGVERLIGACAMNDAGAIAAAEPALVAAVLAQGSILLPEFAGTDNAEGIRHLLDLGINVDVRYHGDGYYQIPPHSTALHVAAWKGMHSAVKLLVEKGADINARDGNGRTPLMLAVRACTDSYWVYRRKATSIAALLQAGASTAGINIPTGYDEADALLK
ncbi:ankyrin repeat domain-containing protein [Chitinophaga cymbidii]|uniref:Uncharacterized protein n=1 Tax=Chitinophaga cymbidii TaxID=1096750 RepID=A0A512RMG6_9BACT|nr:ankyrin repeat domain-containing protein [Chitinophaga cymbidii]GEP96904.1 hypothetical protein CCY01nite_31640 [Chitinophaga cymbidii]